MFLSALLHVNDVPQTLHTVLTLVEELLGTRSGRSLSCSIHKASAHRTFAYALDNYYTPTVELDTSRNNKVPHEQHTC